MLFARLKSISFRVICRRLGIWCATAALLGCLNTAWGQTQTSAKGTITGIVLDSQENSLAGLTVSIRGIGQRSMETRKLVLTDAKGHFAVSGCPFGIYVISAVHNEFPTEVMNPTKPGNSIVATILLSASFPAASLTMKFGRDTVDVTGTVRDAVTGQPVIARLDIKSSASGQSWFSGGIPANYRILIPRKTDLSVQISSPGYKTWSYPGASPLSTGHSLNLQIGSNKHVDVVLKPMGN